MNREADITGEGIMSKPAAHPDSGKRSKPPLSGIMASATQTNTGLHLGTWAIDDTVTSLRALGGGQHYALKIPPEAGRVSAKRRGSADSIPVLTFDQAYYLGSAADCQIRIQDPLQRVSRRHAQVFYRDGYWNVLDLGSKNGTFVDGLRQHTARLTPGMLLGVGGVTLIAESRRSSDLHGFLGRLLGWGWNDETEAVVERAFQDLRTAQLHGEPIRLQSKGEGDLAPIAADLHRYLFSPSAPFVMCDRRRQPGDKDARCPANEDELSKAVAKARGGTVCVRSHRLPQGLGEFLRTQRNGAVRSGAQVMILIEEVALDATSASESVIFIPPLRTRSPAQIANVVREYFLEATASLGVDAPTLPEDREWVLEHAASSFAEVAKAARRITALRLSGSLPGAAEMLGLATVSLRRWLMRRAMPAWLTDPDVANAADEIIREDSESEGEPE